MLNRDLHVAPGVVVPAGAVDWRADRAGGPGGQHVNKVATKITLHVDLSQVTGLDPGARARLTALAGSRLTQAGELVVSASASRHQAENRQLALDKLADLIRRALVPPVPRKATRATRGSKERRLEGKRKDASKKQGRGKVDWD